ncbi:MAG: ribbon-helix-helix protein, CopG family [Candidatus Eremiobacteraeota bacterium]|nr:ribbon-helix-helix protein, CopG family [Candidatus Eremiobacteraeota bacterium]
MQEFHGGIVQRREDGQGLSLTRLSVTIEDELGDRVKRLAFEQGISVSSLIEVALERFIDGKTNDQLGRAAKRSGASLRRRD